MRKDITLIVRNHLYASVPKSISVNAKILILFYKISIFAFKKIVLEQRYLEMIAPIQWCGIQIYIGVFGVMLQNSPKKSKSP